MLPVILRVTFDMACFKKWLHRMTNSRVNKPNLSGLLTEDAPEDFASACI